jgi:putative transposase
MRPMTKLKNTPKVPARKRTASILIEDVERAALAARQSASADACKLLAAIVVETRCRDRYALHKLAYRPLRAETPLGSQACCNALRRVTGPHRSRRSNGEIARDKLVPAIDLRRAGVHFDVRTLTPR